MQIGRHDMVDQMNSVFAILPGGKEAPAVSGIDRNWRSPEASAEKEQCQL